MEFGKSRLVIASMSLGLALVSASACTHGGDSSAPPPPPATAVPAQPDGFAESVAVSMRATVKSVDLKSRTVTLIGPEGETKALKVGPEVQNLPQVKPGDVVVARYRESMAFLIAPPGTLIPDAQAAAAAAQAVPGQLPAGAVENAVAVTAQVVGVNLAAHTLSLVGPEGGAPRSVVIRGADAQRVLPSIKIGDTITAVISDAIVVAVEPAK